MFSLSLSLFCALSLCVVARGSLSLPRSLSPLPFPLSIPRGLISRVLVVTLAVVVARETLRGKKRGMCVCVCVAIFIYSHYSCSSLWLDSSGGEE